VGHQGLVYDLDWSPRDTLLLSASADCTACLWDTEGQTSRLLQVRLYLSSHFNIKFMFTSGAHLEFFTQGG
jgi:WD40 repeat protein